MLFRSNAVLPTIDGYLSPSVGYRVLVKNQTLPEQNGIYDITDLGQADPGGRPWILTRSTDFDNSPAGEVQPGDFTFIQEGDTLAGTGWVETAVGSGPGETIIIGTDPIIFAQFSGAGTYSAGTGLTLTGTTFSVNNTQSQITAVGTLTSLNVSGNIAAGNIAGGNLVSANYLQGTLITSAQPNITSTGILTSLSVSGNANIGNIGTGIITASGDITGANLITGGDISVTGNANVGNLSLVAAFQHQAI